MTPPSPADLLSGAVALHQAGNLDEAEILYKTLLTADTGNAYILHMLGMLQFQKGKPEEALWLIGNAVTINPHYAEAYSSQGYVLNHLKQYSAAVASYDKSLTLKPDNADVYNKRGIALYNLKQYSDAIASYDKVIALTPLYADAHNNRGNALYALQRHHEAMASYDKAIALKPDYAEAYTHRGNILHQIVQHDAALANFDKAIAINPSYADAYYNRGISLQKLKRYDEALADYDKAITLHPEYADACYAKGLIKLTRGEYAQGWALHEWRWKTKNAYADERIYTMPLWLGKESLDGKTILLHAEQGQGDIIQFCRYVPMVEALGATVVLDVPDMLSGVISTLPSSFQLLKSGSPISGFDFHCPLLSLPLAFGTTVETIPSEPYLSAQPEFIEKWHSILNARLGTQTLRIGLCWAGGQRPDRPDCVAIDARRSVDFNTLKPLFDIPNTSFVSLQLGPPKDQLDDTRVTDISSELKNWSDTAAVISLLDLVITVDTSVCHLAGAMGKKTWLLNRYDTCWRWLLDRDDSPWYPSLTQFRQHTPGNWDEVIAKVHKMLVSANARQ